MSYGYTQYGLLPFGVGPDDNVLPPDAEIPNLLEYLPRYYFDIGVAVNITEVEAAEIGLLRYRITDLLAQFFVDTATWGLSVWEAEFGLTVDPSKPTERRREQLRAKIRGSGTTTRQMIVDTAAAFSGGDVDVTEYPAEARFEVRFIGQLGIPPNMPDFLAMLDAIKPAHLSYTILYTYTTWDMVGGLTWADAGTRTWQELRTYEEE
ncbi:YmfQ family protein [Mycobacterium gordonae]|nr:YmfQ family protein [Mycobacterium gordonae]